MEKFKKYLPQGLLLSFIIKMLAQEASFSDMGIVFALAGVVGLTVYLEKRQELQEVKEAMQKKCDEQNLMINKASEIIQVIAVEHAKMKSIVEGLKLKNDYGQGNGLKKVI